MERELSPRVGFNVCPIRSSLGVLGRRWTLLVLRDISFFPEARFSDMLRNNSGLSPRVLSIRLRELQSEGLIERSEVPGHPRDVHYRLTRKGEDVIPILSAFIQYGAKHRAHEVFKDGKSRRIGQLFPGESEFMLGPLHEYAMQPSRSTKGSAPGLRKTT
jgi:DNA-binding HxlR family transcriptional regulator